MDHRQQAMCDRLESRLVSLLKAAPDWQDAAEEIAAGLELSNPDLSDPQSFVDSVAPKLPTLARQAVQNRMSPADLDKISNPRDLVNNLL